MTSSAPPSATLSELESALGKYQSVERLGADVTVVDVHLDSRSVVPGCLYVAIRGARADGHDYIPEAIESGATAVAVEQANPTAIPQLVVQDTRAALGWLAAETHGHPARRLRMVGITGTNGKTTVAHMMASMTAGSPRKTAVIGTVSSNIPDVTESPRTTPEASNLQRMLRRMVDLGTITDVAIEVSSHAMDMGRVNGVAFDVVAFTNLSQDHLDYHHTMEAYYQAKARLFSKTWASRAVIWIDGPWGRRLAGETELPTTTVGTSPDADVRVVQRTTNPRGSEFDLVTDGGTYRVAIPVAGTFNVANAAIAATCSALIGIDLEAAVANIAAMDPIPGRYNTIDSAVGSWVVVDYAHTPDAIANVVAESRSHVPGRIIVVIGAGGDRDREKRPLMGRAAGTADLVVVTDDNPRSEDPDKIVADVVSGIQPGPEVVIERDRRLAIRHALLSAGADDAVLILGKGHETGQEFADETLPFDDAAVARHEIVGLESTP